MNPALWACLVLVVNLMLVVLLMGVCLLVIILVISWILELWEEFKDGYREE